MALHLSVKLCAIGFVIASLLTAFRAPPVTVNVNLTITPSIMVLAEPLTAANSGTRYRDQGPDPNPSFVLRATGYNSDANQTDSTPFVTATGAQTHWGIIAVSRDLLDESIPYGSLVRIKDFGGYSDGRNPGAFQQILDEQDLFVVEDTMHRRKRQQIDVWFPEYHQAISWGVRRVEVEVVRYGRDGPILDYAAQHQAFAVIPRFQASK